ncbi:MAG: hypothetical protein LKE31_03930 [Bacilli bacterium]|jgi:hypothetical protein|nr:hypothetical protein [Bacilli bacterium]
MNKNEVEQYVVKQQTSGVSDQRIAHRILNATWAGYISPKVGEEITKRLGHVIPKTSQCRLRSRRHCRAWYDAYCTLNYYAAFKE